MPIYSYRCETCGHQQDVLRKMSDPLLVDCPSCGAPTFRKQVTAAGFQLKGSGWYVTDFRNPAGKEASKGAGKSDGDAAPAPAAADSGAPATGGGDAPKAAPAAAPTPSPAPAPAARSDSGGGKAGSSSSSGST